MLKLLENPIKTNYESLLDNLRRKGTPKRVHNIELFLDKEIKYSIDQLYGLSQGIPKEKLMREEMSEIRLQRFLGYDYVSSGVSGMVLPLKRLHKQDTVTDVLQKRSNRSWANEHGGPIQNWKDFEKYPWPDPINFRTDQLEWYSKNLDEEMCIIGMYPDIFEQIVGLMGFTGFSYAVFDNMDLVEEMFNKIGNLCYQYIKLLCQFDRVKILFGGDDMGFKTGLMVKPDILIKNLFPFWKKNAALAHEYGKLYLLHSCGDIKELMHALINDVKIDGKHSFEDAILPVTEAKKEYGSHIAVLGGIDMDFICRANEEVIRKRVRQTLDICQPGGGYCLGTGNSVANYIPVKNFLIMLDEGRKYV